MIMPGVQNPHWRPCFSQKPCWSGCRPSLGGHPLDRRDAAAVGLDGEHRAGLDRLAVDVDGARAALARVAADVGAGEVEVLADQLDQEASGLDVRLASLPVDRERNMLGHQ